MSVEFIGGMSSEIRRTHGQGAVFSTARNTELSGRSSCHNCRVPLWTGLGGISARNAGCLCMDWRASLCELSIIVWSVLSSNNIIVRPTGIRRGGTLGAPRLRVILLTSAPTNHPSSLTTSLPSSQLQPPGPPIYPNVKQIRYCMLPV